MHRAGRRRAQGTKATVPCCLSKHQKRQESTMHNIFYIIGVIVVVGFILSFLGIL